MGQPTVVLFGSIHHPVLTVLYHYLQQRGRRRVVFLRNELFPQQPEFFYHLSTDASSGRFFIEDEEKVDLDDVVATGLDGFRIHPPGLENYSPADQEYLQTESWATLIALFEALALRGPVANHVMFRDVFQSRLAVLGYFRSFGLGGPPLCLTSDPDMAAAFLEKYAGRVVYRPLTGAGLPLQPWREQDRGRLERLPLCPVHFEARLDGPITRLTRVGQHWLGAEDGPPESVLDSLSTACDDLGLNLAEVTLHQGQQWSVLDVLPFISQTPLARPEHADLVATFLEEGGQL